MEFTNDAEVVLYGGTLSNVNNSDIIIGNKSVPGATLLVDGGTLNSDDALFVGNSSVVTISNGTLTADGGFMGVLFQTSGTWNFCGGTVEGQTFSTKGQKIVMGGTSPGTATFANWGTDGGSFHNDSSIDIDFLSNTAMTLSFTNARDLVFAPGTNWAEALWDSDQLKYHGRTSTDLSTDWATATAFNGLGDFNRFDHDGTNLFLINETPASGILFRIR